MPYHPVGLTIAAALLLGIVAGMRSMTAPAAVSILLWRRPELDPHVAPAQWFAHAWVALVLAIAAVGELIADKLPRTPNRTALGPFLGRVITGGLSGAAAAQIGNLSGWIGAICGIAGAVVSTFAMFHARRAVVRGTSLPDPFVGAVEDILALCLAVVAAWMLMQ